MKPKKGEKQQTSIKIVTTITLSNTTQNKPFFRRGIKDFFST